MMTHAVLLSLALAAVFVGTGALPTPSTIVPEFVEESTLAVHPWGDCVGWANKWDTYKNDFEKKVPIRTPKSTFLKVRVTTSIEKSLKRVDAACNHGLAPQMFEQIACFKRNLDKWIGASGSLGKALADPKQPYKPSLAAIAPFLESIYNDAIKIANAIDAHFAHTRAPGGTDNPLYGVVGNPAPYEVPTVTGHYDKTVHANKEGKKKAGGPAYDKTVHANTPKKGGATGGATYDKIVHAIEKGAAKGGKPGEPLYDSIEHSYASIGSGTGAHGGNKHFALVRPDFADSYSCENSWESFDEGSLNTPPGSRSGSFN